jgi:hypothetical protein
MMRKSMPEGFVEEWERLIRLEPGRQVEVGGGHPLWLMYGSDQTQRPIFFVISNVKPGLVSLSDVVEVQRGLRSVDSRWTLSLTLRDSRFISEFIRLGNELIDSTSSGCNESHALQLLVEAVKHWKGLFSYSPPQQLSKSQIRGLLGEMWFGFDRLTESFETTTILQAWGGPFGSPQDFNLPSGQAFEVKTVYSDAKSVRISSAEQLDVDNRVLELAVVTLTDVDESSAGAISLPTMVQHVDDILDAADHEELIRRLRALAVDITDTFYGDFWFRVDACTTYRIDRAFPAIRRSSLSPVIDDVQYDLALYGITDFTASSWRPGRDAADDANGEDQLDKGLR